MNQLYASIYNRLGYAAEERTEGIFLLRMDPDSGRIETVEQFEAGPNPTYLAFHSSGRFLYAVNEQADGGLSAFARDPESGHLALLNTVPSEGADPCYVSLDPSGHWLLAANYASGSLGVAPVGADGRLGPPVDRIQHTGSGPRLDRQASAHAHSILFDPSGRFVLSADLGMDRIFIYRLDDTKGVLIPNQPAGLDLSPGSGPRHIIFHPNGQVAYVTTELANTVVVCGWDQEAGRLTQRQTISSLPEGYAGENTAADLHCSPDGRHLYVSNRGHNSIAIFDIDQEEGRLDETAWVPVQGDWPRNFVIHPNGRFLIVANQRSGNLVVFRRDGVSGGLLPTGQEIALPSPVCLKFAP